MPTLKHRPTLANWLLVVAFLGFSFLVLRCPLQAGTIQAVLGTLALYLVFLLPTLYFLLVWLVISLLVLIPVGTVVLLLVRAFRRRQRERVARRQLELLRSPFSQPAAQHEEKPLPWMQRRFNHPTQV